MATIMAETAMGLAMGEVELSYSGENVSGTKLERITLKLILTLTL